ncbi:hypothetical protein L3X38_033752 [Prunus dulcis]|uniref:Uncharacterized protein n=1 Tax=Prunus dulcis TaxID=3755 RepID=A0AAD4VHZ7_PRUDU|nr:hypothetical protein L3X38_033752 [Prunus dulcis]
MAIVVRFVDCDGFIRERFFDIESVANTNALTLKNEICKYFRRNELNLIRKDELKELLDSGELKTDSMLRQLNNRFPEQIVELFTLSSSLDPRNSLKSFNIEHICKLAEKFYPADFLPHELKALET